MFGKFSEAVSDLSETLRRVFQAPVTHAFDPTITTPRAEGVLTLNVAALAPNFALCPTPVGLNLAFPVLSTHLPTVFEGRLMAEDGWEQWSTGAVVCHMPVFGKAGGRQVGIPPLPRRATCYREETGAFRTSTRALQEPFPVPAVRGGSPNLGNAVTHSALEMALGLPIAFIGQDVLTLPRPIWMRYSLQLVKTTGENIRNLEVLGLYRIPSKGVAGMRHDAKTGHLLLELTREAANVKRQAFLLARRKDDRSLVSCFLEEA